MVGRRLTDSAKRLSRRDALRRFVFDLPHAVDTLTYMRFTAILEPQAEGGYHAMCPTLPGCHSEGDTLDETIVNIREAIAVYIESMKAHGETPPIEDILIKPLDIAIAG